MFCDFEINPQSTTTTTTPNTAQNPVPSTEKAMPEKMGREGSSCENSLSPISQIVSFDMDVPEDNLNPDRYSRDTNQGSSVDDDEEIRDLIPKIGTLQEPHSEEVIRRSKLASLCKAVTDVFAESLKTLDGERWAKIPRPEPQNGAAEKGNEKQQLVSSALEGQPLEETGAHQGICHQCCGNGAGPEKAMAGITRPTITGIQDVNDIADPDPKALMPDVANPDATASIREVVQPIPGSWPNYLEGKRDRRTSDVKNQDEGKDRADLPWTNGDLRLLSAFGRLFL